MDFLIYWVFLPSMYLLLASVVVIKGKDVLRQRRLERRKKELMEWLHYLGLGMDIVWKNQGGYTKDSTKKWIAEMTTLYFEEIKRREYDN